MSELEQLLKHLNKIESEATEAKAWGPYAANIPFYAQVTKPAPSMSKHDEKRATYWRVEDAIFVGASRKSFKILLDIIEKQSQVLTFLGAKENHCPYKKRGDACICESCIIEGTNAYVNELAGNLHV